MTSSLGEMRAQRASRLTNDYMEITAHNISSLGDMRDVSEGGMWCGGSEAGDECMLIPLRILFPILAGRIE